MRCKRAASWQRPFVAGSWRTGKLVGQSRPLIGPPATHTIIAHACDFWHVKALPTMPPMPPCCLPAACSDSPKHLIYFQRYAPYLDASMLHSQANSSLGSPCSLHWLLFPASGSTVSLKLLLPPHLRALSSPNRCGHDTCVLRHCSWMGGAILVPLSA